MSAYNSVLVSVGLVLDIVGVLLLAFFGLPPKVDPEGKIYLVAEQDDAAEIAKGRRYRRLQWLGIVLIVGGFALQFAGNLIR